MSDQRYNFDKFIRDIRRHELERAKTENQSYESHKDINRVRDKRNREVHHNRIVWRRK